MPRLVTTYESIPDHSTSDIVYLGPWCIPNSRMNSSLLTKTNCINFLNPSIGERRKRVQHVDRVAKRIAVDLAGSLNRIHQTEYNLLYWETCIGFWLSMFLDSLYDRWASVQAVKEFGTELSFKSCFISESERIPNSTSEFNFLSQTEKWNRYIFEQALKDIKNVNIFSENLSSDSKPPNHRNTHKPRKLRFGKVKVRLLINAIAKRRSNIICTTYLPRHAEWKLALMLRTVPLYWIEPTNPQHIESPMLRKRFTLPIVGDEFESFARTLIPGQIPRSFIENYGSICSGIYDLLGTNNPGAIFTSNLHFSSDSFSIWAAEAREQGCKLFLSQHGGLNGQGLIPTRTEIHESHIADCHLPWGWREDSQRSRNVPALINVGKKEFGDQSGASKLLVITDCTYRYGRQPWMNSIDNQIYIANVQKLVLNLPIEIQSQAIVRLHHHHAEYDYSQSLLWSEARPGTVIDDGSTPIDKLRKLSRLSICTTLGTSEIEQFARNFPTILMLDPQTHPIRENCQNLFSRMQSVGLVHESPKSASEHITNIWSDTNTWWLEKEIQDLVAEYLYRFGRKHEHPLRELKRVITSVSKS